MARSGSLAACCAFTRRPAARRLTAQQPEVNVVRVALQAMAAVLGRHAIAAHQWAGRSAVAADREERRRLRLRTQQVIAYESGVTAEPDPLGGSEYVERLTTEIEKGAREYIRQIDAMGGTLRPSRTASCRTRFRRRPTISEGRGRGAADRGRREQVSKRRGGAAEAVSRRSGTGAAAGGAIAGGAGGAFGNGCYGRARTFGASGARNGEFAAAYFECCRAHVTVGEISDTLRTVFGEYREGF